MANINLLPKKENHLKNLFYKIDWNIVSMWVYVGGTILFVVGTLVYGLLIRPRRLDAECKNKYGQMYKGVLRWNKYSVDLCVGERGELRLP